MHVARPKNTVIAFLLLLLSFCSCNKEGERLFIEVKSYGGDVVINNQEGLDDFSNGNYEVIEGSLVIGGEVSSLQALSDLTLIEGDLIVSNTQLSTLEGLNNLSEVSGSISITDNSFASDLNFCALQPLFSMGVFNEVTISNNNDFNPTAIDIAQGNCKAYDCPSYQANIGDSCVNGPITSVLNVSCECELPTL